jgi:predicted DNA-binding transcriptional regulator AlpA
MKETVTSPPELAVSPTAAGRMLGLSRSTVYQSIARGDLPAFRLREHGALRVPVEHVRRLIDERTAAGPDADFGAPIASGKTLTK